MVIVTCIEKIYDKFNGKKITGYVLKDNLGNTKMVKPEELKQAIRKRTIQVDNLTLTSDNRLITTKNKVETYKITKELIKKINSTSKLSFQTLSKESVEKIILKAKIIGLNVLEVDKEVYAIINANKHSTNIVSYKKFILYDAENLFIDTDFKYIDLSNINTEKCTSMSYMFVGCNAENINLSKLNTKNVTDMSYMFYVCDNLKALDLKGLDTRNVTNMVGMFLECNNLKELDLKNLDTRNVTNMSGMFEKCTSLKRLDLSGLNTSKVEDMSGMFFESIIDNLILGDLDTSNVKRTCNMFYSFETKGGLDIYRLNLENVENMIRMFHSATAKYIDMHNMKLLKVTNIDNIFSFTTTTKIDLYGLKIPKVNDASYMFRSANIEQTIDLRGIDTSNITKTMMMFYGINMPNGEIEGLEEFNTSNLQDAESMFENSNIQTIKLANFNTQKLKNADDMFINCEANKLDLSNFDLTALNNSDEILINCDTIEELNKKIIFPKDAKLRQLILKHCRVNGKKISLKVKKEGKRK